MSNSKLVDYTCISPNKTSPRNAKIDTITIHCTAVQVSAERLGEIFLATSRNASCNYGIAKDGKIVMCVEEKDRSWCSSDRDNDNRAITIEVSSDNVHPYKVNDATFESLIKLLADICKRNDIKELKWKADKTLIGNVAKQNMTVHRWFANKACPGEYLYSRHGEIAEKVNAILNTPATTKVINPYPVPTRTIYYNSYGILTGNDVKYVQFCVGATVDGKCGPATDRTIRSWQKANKLTVDGKFGPACRKVAAKLYA